MRRSTFSLGVVLLVGCGPPATTPAPDRLLPDEAFLFGVLESVESWERRVEGTASAVAPEREERREGGGFRRAFGDLCMSPTLRGVDRTRPLGFAIVGLPEGPQPVAFVPVLSERTFRKGWSGNPRTQYLAFHGNTAVVSESIEAGKRCVPRSEGPERLRPRVAGDLAVACDVKGLVERYRDEIEEALRSFEKVLAREEDLAAGFGPAVVEFVELAFRMVRRVVFGTEALHLALRLDGGRVRLEGWVRAIEGSKAAEFLAGIGSAPVALDRLPLDGDFLSQMTLKGYAPWGGFVEALSGMIGRGLPEADREAFTRLSKELAEASVGTTLSSGEMDANGMRAIGLSRLEDPADYERATEAYWSFLVERRDSLRQVPGFPLGQLYEEFREWRHDGVRILEVSTALAEMPVLPGTEAFREMLGGELKMATAVVGQDVVVAMGKDASEAIRSAIDFVRSGRRFDLPEPVRSALEGFPKEVSVLVWLDLRFFLEMAALSPEVRGLSPPAGASMPLAFYFLANGREGTGALDLDLASWARVLGPIADAWPRRPR